MQLGMIGLGRMGASMVRRLMSKGHGCVVHDMQPAAIDALAKDGATGAPTFADMAKAMTAPRAIWLMVPAAVVDATLADLRPHLEPGDIVIDGGNSYYHDDLRRAAELKSAGLHYVDVGTSGGIAGRDRGYCLMIGGEPETVARLSPIFEALAPGVGEAPRSPGLSGPPSDAEQGFLHCGPHGAGHFVKMVHNGIEYGDHGRIRRGPEHPAQCQRRQARSPRRRRRDGTAAPSRVLPVRHGPCRKSRSSGAPRQRGRVRGCST